MTRRLVFVILSKLSAGTAPKEAGKAGSGPNLENDTEARRAQEKVREIARSNQRKFRRVEMLSEVKTELDIEGLNTRV